MAVFGMGVVAGEAGELTLWTQVQVLGDPHGRPDAHAVIEVVLQGGLVALLTEAVDVLPEDLLLHQCAGAGDEEVAVGAPLVLKIVRGLLAGRADGGEEESQKRENQGRLSHGGVLG